MLFLSLWSFLGKIAVKRHVQITYDFWCFWNSPPLLHITFGFALPNFQSMKGLTSIQVQQTDQFVTSQRQISSKKCADFDEKRKKNTVNFEIFLTCFVTAPIPFQQLSCHMTFGQLPPPAEASYDILTFPKLKIQLSLMSNVFFRNSRSNSWYVCR